MPVELVVPTVGESITEVEIGDWLKSEGEHVDQDDPVVVIETDKVTVELPAPASGVITRHLKQKGEKAAVGDVIGYLEEAHAASTETPSEASTPIPTSAPATESSRPAPSEPRS